MWHRTQIEAFFLSKTLSLSLRLACATHSLVFRRNVLSDLFNFILFVFMLCFVFFDMGSRFLKGRRHEKPGQGVVLTLGSLVEYCKIKEPTSHIFSGSTESRVDRNNGVLYVI